MRIRCSKGLRISAFHGHFFIRSSDLLALPQVPTPPPPPPPPPTPALYMPLTLAQLHQHYPMSRGCGLLLPRLSQGPTLGSQMSGFLWHTQVHDPLGVTAQAGHTS